MQFQRLFPMLSEQTLRKLLKWWQRCVAAVTVIPQKRKRLIWVGRPALRQRCSTEATVCAHTAVSVAATRELGLDPEKVNVHGGAIALGHPIGSSGARLVVHAAHELSRRGGGRAAVALCGGGGQGDALLLRR